MGKMYSVLGLILYVFMMATVGLSLISSTIFPMIFAISNPITSMVMFVALMLSIFIVIPYVVWVASGREES